MTIKFAAGFLPYIYKLDPEGFVKGELGRQRGPFVTVQNEDTALLMHEEHHIKQFYVTFTLGALFLCLGYFYALPILYVVPAFMASLDFIPYTSFRKEAAAYAVSVAHGRDLESAASALSRHRYAQGDRSVAREAILTRFFGLF